MSTFRAGLGVVLALTAAAFHVQAETVQLTPVKNNTLYAPLGGSLASNGAGSFLFAGDAGATSAGTTRRALLAFDIAAGVPAGSTITSVTLTLHLSRTVGGAENAALHRVSADWGEGTSHAAGEEGTGAAPTTGDATWLHRFFPDTLWAAPGGDFSAAASASISVAGVAFYTWGSNAQMVADVQAWLDTPAGNFGWILLGNESAPSTTKRFDSRHNPTAANQPTLTVVFSPSTALPVITAQPGNQSVCAGQPVTFSATADRATGFQWQRNGVNLTGATGASFSISAVTAGDAGSYTVIVSNTSGALTSNAAVLTVLGVPVIIGQPSSQTLAAGGSATFSVTASGATSFQWQKNAVAVPGATRSSLAINPVQAADAGMYAVVVQNACGSVTSSVATLTVAGGSPPPQPGAPPTITVQPQSQTVCPGAAVTLAVSATGATAYQWRKDGVALAGATSASFVIAAVSSSDAGPYDVVVSNSGGAVTSTPASLTVGGPPVITAQPVDQQAEAGAAASFSATATGATTYQWNKDGAEIQGASSATFTIAAVEPNDAGGYNVVVASTCGSVTSTTATLTVTPPRPAACGAMPCGAGVVPFLPLTLAGLGWLKLRSTRR